MSDPADQPTIAVAHGDPALARHLRQSLEVLRDRSEDREFRDLVDDVLHGRTDLRDAYSSATFAAGLDTHVEQFAERYEELSPEERQRLAEQGRRSLDTLRERLADEEAGHDR
ncbi:hypothetical protein ACWKSP_06485 [Micromonosporaceae bacterium Da 78-11]